VKLKKKPEKKNDCKDKLEDICNKFNDDGNGGETPLEGEGSKQPKKLKKSKHH